MTEENKSIVLFNPVFSDWQTGNHGGASFLAREFKWGAPYEVSITLGMIVGTGGGADSLC
jgi:hypothetical protein